MFSHRLPWPCPPNRLSRLLQDKRRRNVDLFDLTDSNPTGVGLDYPEREIAVALTSSGAASYSPDPRGAPGAREAVAAYYARRGFDVAAERIVLTASTSEAYALLFKLTLDPGRAVLIPRPSYPLFDFLAALEGTRVIGYRIRLDGDRFSIDLASIEGADPEAQAGALVTVNPNNPTGSALTPGERAALDRICASRDIPLIADEVFLDYRFDPAAAVVSTLSPRNGVGDEASALTFTFGGLSKGCGLPQLKLAWIIVGGPDALVGEALQRLELIADNYLSVATPVQSGADRLIGIGERLQRQIRARIVQNRRALIDALGPASACRVLDADGGWSAVLRVPAVVPEEDLVLDLLERSDVLVHPGYFFDFEREAFLIISLLPLPERFGEGIGRILARIENQ